MGRLGAVCCVNCGTCGRLRNSFASITRAQRGVLQWCPAAKDVVALVETQFSMASVLLRGVDIAEALGALRHVLGEWIRIELMLWLHRMAGSTLLTVSIEEGELGSPASAALYLRHFTALTVVQLECDDVRDCFFVDLLT